MHRSVPAALAIFSLFFASLSGCATTDNGKGPDNGGSDADTTAAARALDALANLASERVATADRVAASKYGTDKPIEDPAREKQVLDDAAQRAADMGIDGDAVLRVFRDQIEANKLVQRGLYARWDAAPEKRPTDRPDLAKEVRPVLDRIGSELLVAIRDAQPLLSGVKCKASLEQSHRQTATAMNLDELHASGLDRALLHVCP